MNKKILIPIVVAAAILPVLAFSALSPGVDADKLGKEFAAENPGFAISTHSLEEDISEQEEVNRATIIIEGVVTQEKPFWRMHSGDTIPRIYTEYDVKVNAVMKGSVAEGQTVSVLFRGGSLDGVTMYASGAEVELNDHVIMLLGRDPLSIWGDSYFPISVSKSTYLLDGDLAKNHIESRNMDKTELKEKLTRLSGN